MASQRNVVAALSVGSERCKPRGRVVMPSCVVKGSEEPHGGVVAAGSVVSERFKTRGRVEAPGCVQL